MFNIKQQFAFPSYIKEKYSRIDLNKLNNILKPNAKPFQIKDRLKRRDETTDADFYSHPRFVHHIDDRARYILHRFYKHIIPQKESVRTLDLCSSWTSHLPEDFIGKVHGLGMNRPELSSNPSFNDGFTVHDLNADPKINFSNETFDAVICSVSVDYLNRPKEVFQEISRILKPGGLFVTSFSNRCFPTKVISNWLSMSEQERVEWVANYFYNCDAFDANSIKAHSLLENQEDNEYVDPMYVVYGK
ncbi:demethylmenaquinone methyltransferase [Acrasis kona]|uniref:Demethylmenaquinone methyltransferase n=1 Tax=Acrasis kona TaxID=1008807 RepID=A0AAW2ZPI3_9EUKA